MELLSRAPLSVLQALPFAGPVCRWSFFTSVSGMSGSRVYAVMLHDLSGFLPSFLILILPIPFSFISLCVGLASFYLLLSFYSMFLSPTPAHINPMLFCLCMTYINQLYHELYVFYTSCQADRYHDVFGIGSTDAYIHPGHVVSRVTIFLLHLVPPSPILCWCYFLFCVGHDVMHLLWVLFSPLLILFLICASLLLFT